MDNKERLMHWVGHLLYNELMYISKHILYAICF
jgi:hypothetical protein